MAATHILVPIDFQPGSDLAARCAFAYARQCGARVTLLSAVELAIAGEEMGVPRCKLLQELILETDQKLAQRTDGLAVPGVCIRRVIVGGRPAASILEYAGRSKADLIVMAKPRDTWWRRLFGRQTCETVARLATCPVWLVRPARGKIGADPGHEVTSPAEQVFLRNRPSPALN